jgi:hypothetical protein
MMKISSRSGLSAKALTTRRATATRPPIKTSTSRLASAPPWAKTLAEFLKKSVMDADSRRMRGSKVMAGDIQASQGVGHTWPIED